MTAGQAHALDPQEEQAPPGPPLLHSLTRTCTISVDLTGKALLTMELDDMLSVRV